MTEQNDLFDVLGARNIAQPGNAGISADPLTGTILRVPVGEIDPYHLNPRKSRNARYDEIKENIRRLGQLQPFGVTRPPDNQRWMVAGGGNTRRDILDELHAETGDSERFGYAKVYVVPWDSHVERLLAHWIENEQRSGVTFIDRAMSRREARGLIEEERRTEAANRGGEAPAPMTLKEFAETLTERLGYRVHQPDLTVMDYAVDRLLPGIPRALEAGMGRPGVRALRKLDNAGAAAWDVLTEERDAPKEGAYDLVFQAALVACDDDTLDMSWFQEELEERMAEASDQPLRLVRMEVHHALSGSRGERGPEAPPTDAAPLAPSSPAEAVSPAAESPAAQRPASPKLAPTLESPTATPAPTTPPQELTTTAAAVAPQPPAKGEEAGAALAPLLDEIRAAQAAHTDPDSIPIDESKPAPKEPPKLPRGLPPRYDGYEDIKTLKSRAYVLAQGLASRVGLQKCVVLSMHAGLGWVMEAPEEPLTGHKRAPGRSVEDQQKARHGRLRLWIWHFLMAASEMLPTFDHQYQHLRFVRMTEIQHYRGELLRQYRDHYLADDPEDTEYERNIGFPALNDLCSELFSNPLLPEPGFQEAMYLIEVCRRIRQEMLAQPGATADANELWGDARQVNPADHGWEGEELDGYEIDKDWNQDEGWEE